MTEEASKKTKIKYNSVNERLLKAEHSLKSAVSDENILKILSGYGFNSEKISEGQRLEAQVRELEKQQKIEHGEENAISQKYSGVFDSVLDNFGKTLKISRIVLKDDPDAVTSLGLFKSRKYSYTGLYEQANMFYKIILENPNYSGKMASFGFSKEKIQSEANLLEELKKLSQEKNQEHSIAVQATRKRDEEIDKFDKWMSDFYKFCKVILADHPEYLSKLGVK